MALIFATGNRHKFEEASELAARHTIELKQRKVLYAEIQADELKQISSLGARHACILLGTPCFVEDAGLFVRALRGFPGPYSKYVFRTLGNEGMLKLMSGKSDRAAEFRSVVAYCEPGGKPRIFSEKVEGVITFEVRGKMGFGFDPIFIPGKGDGRTFAEMSTGEKNELSHRGRAVEKLFKWYVKKRAKR